MLIARDAGKPVGVPGLGGLGLIPSWQFSGDPKINTKINPFVKFPPGVTQMTPQPLAGLMGVTTSLPVWWELISLASAAASTYHGYKRNESIPWALAWGFLGGLFPIVTPAIAAAQGFAKKKK